MRAVAHSHETASLVGIPVSAVISLTFALGSALAAAAAVLYGVKYPQVSAQMGILPGLKAFVAAVLGGIGNIQGAGVLAPHSGGAAASQSRPPAAGPLRLPRPELWLASMRGSQPHDDRC